jgi:hypothetical protein
MRVLTFKEGVVMAGRERESSSDVGPSENREDDYRDAEKRQQFGTVGLHLVLQQINQLYLTHAYPPQH